MFECRLRDKRVAILATDGFEQSELKSPRAVLEKEGALVSIVSLEAGKIRGWNNEDWGESFEVDLPIELARVEDFDGLVLPGGVMNPDQLRNDERAVAFVKNFAESGKPIAAICHGPWTLIDAGVVRGLRMTSWPSLRTDLTNAGAHWVDEEVVNDQRIITSRSPSDLDAFNRQIIEEFMLTEEAGLRTLNPSGSSFDFTDSVSS